MYSHLHVDATFGFAPYSIIEFWHYSPFIVTPLVLRCKSQVKNIYEHCI
jgi:hypothetical protein